MISDLNSLANVDALDADVCIIGSGAAALAVARELLDSPLKVVMLEGGGAVDEPASTDLYNASISGLRFVGHWLGRFRVLGGATTRWGGQALPLTPLDFERRDWVPHSGWPISYDEVTPFYPRAARFMLIDEENYGTDWFTRFGAIPPSFNPQLLHYHFSKWSPRPDLRTVYRPSIARSASLHLLLHANVTEIRLSDDLSAVTHIVARSLQGKSITVRARQFILCVGGIETARVLLANNAQCKLGIGNHSDWVGKCFQDHPASQIGVLIPRDDRQLQRQFNLFHNAGRKYAVRVSASPALLRERRLLNASSAIVFDPGEGSAVAALKDAYGMIRQRRLAPALAGKLLRAAMGAGSIMPVLYQYYFRRRTYVPNATARVMLLTEQEPNPQSRITLTNETDALGMRRCDIHWALTDLTGRTFFEFSRVLKEQFESAGIGTLRLEDWIERESSDWRQHITDQLHHISSARMSASPADGVVDRECRIHGIANLTIGGSAIFPTSGHSNPTLTLIALAIRAADRFKRELR